MYKKKTTSDVKFTDQRIKLNIYNVIIIILPVCLLEKKWLSAFRCYVCRNIKKKNMYDVIIMALINYLTIN